MAEATRDINVPLLEKDDVDSNAIADEENPDLVDEDTAVSPEQGERNDHPFSFARRREYWVGSAQWSFVALMLTFTASCLPIATIDGSFLTTNYDAQNEASADANRDPDDCVVAINPWFTNSRKVWKHLGNHATLLDSWIASRCLVNAANILASLLLAEMLAHFLVLVYQEDTFWIGFRVRVPGTTFCRYAQQIMRLCMVLLVLGLLCFVLFWEHQFGAGVSVMTLGILSWIKAYWDMSLCVLVDAPLLDIPPSPALVELTEVTNSNQNSHVPLETSQNEPEETTA